MQFGYLPQSDLETGNLRSEDQIRDAIKTMQVPIKTYINGINDYRIIILTKSIRRKLKTQKQHTKNAGRAMTISCLSLFEVSHGNCSEQPILFSTGIPAPSPAVFSTGIFQSGTSASGKHLPGRVHSFFCCCC